MGQNKPNPELIDFSNWPGIEKRNPFHFWSDAWLEWERRFGMFVHRVYKKEGA